MEKNWGKKTSLKNMGVLVYNSPPTLYNNELQAPRRIAKYSGISDAPS